MNQTPCSNPYWDPRPHSTGDYRTHSGQKWPYSQGPPNSSWPYWPRLFGSAQLLLLPYHAPNNYNPITRGKQEFGSTYDQVVCFTQQILSDWPTCKVKIQGKTFSGFLNTRADVSIITSRQWPDDWPLTEPQGKTSGLGEPQQLAQTAAILPYLGPD